MKKIMRRYQNCGCLFEVCTKVKKHEYCNKKKCRRARKSKWQKQKIENDDIYRKDQGCWTYQYMKERPQPQLLGLSIPQLGLYNLLDYLGHIQTCKFWVAPVLLTRNKGFSAKGLRDIDAIIEET